MFGPSTSRMSGRLPAKAPAVTSEATQKLFSHRLPREWEAVVLGDEGRVAAGVQ